MPTEHPVLPADMDATCSHTSASCWTHNSCHPKDTTWGHTVALSLECTGCQLWPVPVVLSAPAKPQTPDKEQSEMAYFGFRREGKAGT